MLDKLGGVFAPRPSTGPHKLRESLPMVVFLRNRLKYALNNAEVTKIVMQRLIKVDGKVRTDSNYPAGFMGKWRKQQSLQLYLTIIFITQMSSLLRRLESFSAWFMMSRVDLPSTELPLRKPRYHSLLTGWCFAIPNYDLWFSTSCARFVVFKLAQREFPLSQPTMDVPFVILTLWLKSTTQSNWTLPPTRSWISSSSNRATCAWSPVVVTWGELVPSWLVNVILDLSTSSTWRMLLVIRLLPGTYFCSC